MATDNKSLGRFILDGIPPAPRGVPQVEVTFDVDANGILQVKAKDKTSGKEQSIRIEASSGLSDEDIKRMQADAEAHADEDSKKKELAEEKNIADALVHTAEKALRDAGDKVGEDVKKEVEEKIASLKSARNGDDSAAIKSATQALSDTMMKIGEAMKTANDNAKTGDDGQQTTDNAGTNADESNKGSADEAK